MISPAGEEALGVNPPSLLRPPHMVISTSSIPSGFLNMWWRMGRLGCSPGTLEEGQGGFSEQCHYPVLKPFWGDRQVSQQRDLESLNSIP
jgi:hypothetical protein